jgi:hypothetical protein
VQHYVATDHHHGMDGVGEVVAPQSRLRTLLQECSAICKKAKKREIAQKRLLTGTLFGLRGSAGRGTVPGSCRHPVGQSGAVNGFN